MKPILIRKLLAVPVALLVLLIISSESIIAQSNPIIAENALPGNPPSEWQVTGAGDLSIQGFTTDISVNKGDTVHFKIDSTNSLGYQIKIYRLGYYGGNGARFITNISPTSVTHQPDPVYDVSTGLADCGNWSESASWAVPADAVSGVYIARPEITNSPAASHIVFVVRDDGGDSDLLFQTDDTTWQAYNTYGGNSLYTGTGPQQSGGRALKVSYNRPYLTRRDSPFTWLFEAQYPMIRWLEANGYNVSYSSGLDTDRHGNLLTQHKTFLSVGHDEYWSAVQRTNVETALAAGVHLAFFSGNEIFWKTRWEPSIDGSSTPNRTLVCYKETHANAKTDPSPEWTGTWRDPRFSPPADGGRPENALSGTLFVVNGYTPIDSIQVPAAYGSHRFWRNTSVASLAPGTTAVLSAGTLGFEWDASPVNGFQPAGLMHLSSNTVSNIPLLQDYGSTYAPGQATHMLSLYRSPTSGALVFGAGTVQWSWGLDTNHDQSIGSDASPAMQQATVNLFADMGVQPGSLQAGLTAAAMSTDVTAPTSTINNPLAGATLTAGTPVAVSGTAGDTGGGQVWSVEVSTDGGTTWFPAVGKESWNYAWTPAVSGPVTLRSRAVDDSGNLEVPSAGVTVTVQSQITIWSGPVSPTPAADPASYELGVKFQSDIDGYVTGIRFYKTAGNGGTHVGNLWTVGGVNLGSATFSGETGSGWQEVNFGTPVAISSNTTYVASYFDPQGHYAVDAGYFAAAVDNPPLHGLANGTSGGNGVFVSSSSSAFPTTSGNGANYWVDLVFAESVGPDTTPPTVTGVSPVGGATGVGINTAVTVTFSEAMNAATITGGGISLAQGVTPVAASVTYNAGTRTATLTPTSPLSLSTVYTVTVAGTITDVAGNQLGSYPPFSFTTTDQAFYSLWTGPVSPTAAADPGSYELGVKFRSDIDGYVTGIRFYKTTGNGGTHVGNLWTVGGVNLGSATFSGETGSGWQQVNFGSPVAISSNTTYVASYFDPQGHYAVDAGYFNTAVDNPPLHGLANGTSGGNGVFVITNSSAFPNNSGGGANYWVDLVFVESVGPDTNGPTVTVVNPANGATGVSRSTTVKLTFNEALDALTVTNGITLTNGAGVLVPSTVAYYSSSNTAVLTPNSLLAFSTPYTVVASAGVKDVAGNPLTNGFTASFTTLDPDVTPPTVVVVNPLNGAVGVPVGTTVKVTFSEAMDPVTITNGVTLTNGVGALVASTVAYYSSSNTAVLTPNSALALSSNYTVVVSTGVEDVSGNALATTFLASFTMTDQAFYSLWTGPVSPMAGTDTGSYELGVRFRSDVDGFVTGIRFYKTAGNGGTHVGNLWTVGGVNLGSATFSGETGSGWQEVNFGTPVAISSNTTYVASYFDPQGHYAFNNPDFTTGVDNPPLHALASGAGGNGVLVATAVSAYPANASGSAANYWVDVAFKPTFATELISLSVAPVNPGIGNGTTQQFTATGTYSDGSTQNVTSQVVWNSGSPGVATINAGGLATGVSAGTTTITATLGSVNGNTTLTVQPTTLAVTTSSLPGGTVGVAYNATLSGSGGTLPYSWSIQSGGLPAGLTLNPASGAITGTPTAAGTSNFTAKVSDASTPTQNATKALSLAVIEAPTTIGNTIAGTQLYAMGAGRIIASRFQAPANLTLTAMTAKVGNNKGKYKCAIYTDNGGRPSRLLKTSTQVSNAKAGWRQFPLTASQTVTNGQYYWLAIWSDNAKAKIYFSSTAGTIRWGQYAYAATWPDPITANSSTNIDCCIYATGTPVSIVTMPPKQPEIVAIGLTNGVITMTWSAVASRSYVLEYVDQLGATNWTPVTPPVLATGPTVTVTDAIGDTPRRFYRLVDESE